MEVTSARMKNVRQAHLHITGPSDGHTIFGQLKAIVPWLTSSSSNRYKRRAACLARIKGALDFEPIYRPWLL